MHLESSAFKDHQPIPKKYTCEGDNKSPPLNIRDIPTGTISLALIVDDPDAPMGTFDHWIVWNLTPKMTVLNEASPVPKQGKNHFGHNKYGGPCPPPGKPHRYFFKLYALDTMLSLPEGSSKEDVEEAMEGHILGRTELVGTYKREK